MMMTVMKIEILMTMLRCGEKDEELRVDRHREVFLFLPRAVSCTVSVRGDTRALVRGGGGRAAPCQLGQPTAMSEMPTIREDALLPMARPLGGDRMPSSRRSVNTLPPLCWRWEASSWHLLRLRPCRFQNPLSCSIRRALGMLVGAPPGEVKKGIPPQILKNLGVEMPYLDLVRSFANPAGTARFVTQLHPRQLVEEAVLFRLICEDSVRGGQGGACIQKRDPVLAQNCMELSPPTRTPQPRKSE